LERNRSTSTTTRKPRINNPSVGPVTLETDRDAGKKIYAYDPHIDPSLQFDPHRSQTVEVGE
jgi:adenine-specific DNA-methyltransferase